MFVSLIKWCSALVGGAQPHPMGTGDLLGLQKLSGRMVTREEKVEGERNRIWLAGKKFWTGVSERHGSYFLIELVFVLVFYILLCKWLSFLKPCFKETSHSLPGKLQLTY